MEWKWIFVSFAKVLCVCCPNSFSQDMFSNGCALKQRPSLEEIELDSHSHLLDSFHNFHAFFLKEEIFKISRDNLPILLRISWGQKGLTWNYTASWCQRRGRTASRFLKHTQLYPQLQQKESKGLCKGQWKISEYDYGVERGMIYKYFKHHWGKLHMSLVPEVFIVIGKTFHSVAKDEPSVVITEIGCKQILSVRWYQKYQGPGVSNVYPEMKTTTKTQ